MVALATAANWRLALLAALTAAAIAATRIRYARLGALFLLVAVLGLAAAGASAGSDDRAAAHAASRSACASVVVAHGQRLAAVRARGASCRTARRVLADWLRRGAREPRHTVRGYRCLAAAGAPKRVTCRRANASVSATYR